MPSGIPLTSQQEDQLITLYQSGLSTEETAKVAGFSHRKIAERVLKRRGIPTRPKGYPIDQSFFDTIDTRQKAYWLGWMLSDGTNASSKGVIRIDLQARDKAVLEKLRGYIGYGGPIYTHKGSKRGHSPQNTYCTLAFTNRRLSNALLKHGCTSRKTYSLEFPTTVPPHLMRDFVRGFVDGDGSFNYLNPRKGFIFSVLGTPSFIEGLRDELHRHLGFYAPVHSCGGEREWMRCIRRNARREVMCLLDWLYGDCGDMYLDRKHTNYLRLKELHRILPFNPRCRAIGGLQFTRHLGAQHGRGAG